ncbi:hypothetical protein FDI24_gp253 [Acidovorax phage ACP17]|uniref:Uncharacterized protein n=1 Tax=Acidovorax phage ACP17 TaxID=2010329 RepID=A0A218M3B1_9CAUD|nr:hypothetical protein FDI24_gp253 [Acidovorax phage ACP17]ASD50534.1 hypothetical protein [Acidovorax phage ACP17]
MLSAVKSCVSRVAKLSKRSSDPDFTTAPWSMTLGFPGTDASIVLHSATPAECKQEAQRLKALGWVATADEPEYKTKFTSP